VKDPKTGEAGNWGGKKKSPKKVKIVGIFGRFLTETHLRSIKQR